MGLGLGAHYRCRILGRGRARAVGVAVAGMTTENDLRHQLEAAQREIDMWWPTIPQGPLYERIRRIHELEVAGDD